METSKDSLNWKTTQQKQFVYFTTFITALVKFMQIQEPVNGSLNTTMTLIIAKELNICGNPIWTSDLAVKSLKTIWWEK